MHEQLSIYDAVTPVPMMWECRDTCIRFGEHIDYPPWWFGGARCLLPNGNNIREVCFDNKAFLYCDLYERRPNDA